MPKHAMIAFCLLVLLVNVSFGAEAPDLAAGIKLYWEAKYKDAAAALKAVRPEDLSSPERVLLFKFIGLTNFARGDQRAAEEAFVKVLSIDPEYKLPEPDFSADVLKCFRKARTTLSNSLSDEGVEQYRLKNNRAAESAFHQALIVDPSNPMAKDFLPLVSTKPEEEKGEEKDEVLCKPALVWGSLDTAKGLCSGVDVSSALHLPVSANKITLMYAIHYKGAGSCWKIVLYDSLGNIVHTFDDPKKEFLDGKTPNPASRWQVVELPEARTVAKAVMYSIASPRSKRVASKDVGNNLLDTFILGLEMACGQGKK